MLIMLFLLDCVSRRTAKETFKAKRGMPERPEGKQEAVRHKDKKEAGEIAAGHDHCQQTENEQQSSRGRHHKDPNEQGNG
jgi:hypothetical protein